MACTTPFDVLRLRVEDLGPTLYVRASYRDPWLNLIPRSEWPMGAGLVRSAFTIGRSEPSTDEETWNAIQTTSGGVFSGSCGVTYNQTFVGYLEETYKPEGFGLVGPLVCQDDLTLHWQSTDFWDKYFMGMEKRNVKSITNRLANIFSNYSTKVSPQGNGTVQRTAGNLSNQPPLSNIDMTDVNMPQCGLTQDILDQEAIVLMESGATDPNSNGWITMGPSGPIFPLLIGPQASNQILLNNAELRDDYRFAFEGKGEVAPVIQRMGASRIIKNWRHMITLFPPRWNNNGTTWTRVPTWLMSTSSTYATKGEVAIVNPQWDDPGYANVEGAWGLNPWVMTEEVLRPVNTAPGMKWTAQNYFGEWRFVTGNDALLGFSNCTGVTDPVHKLGRHFAEYRHAAKPIFPDFGRLFLFQRCPNTIDCGTCS